ncbi:uncharacterized protein LOC144030796 isoform X2 [Festucalex cinctus]
MQGVKGPPRHSGSLARLPLARSSRHWHSHPHRHRSTSTTPDSPHPGTTADRHQDHKEMKMMRMTLALALVLLQQASQALAETCSAEKGAVAVCNKGDDAELTVDAAATANDWTFNCMKYTVPDGKLADGKLTVSGLEIANAGVYEATFDKDGTSTTETFHVGVSVECEAGDCKNVKGGKVTLKSGLPAESTTWSHNSIPLAAGNAKDNLEIPNLGFHHIGTYKASDGTATPVSFTMSIDGLPSKPKEVTLEENKSLDLGTTGVCGHTKWTFNGKPLDAKNVKDGKVSIASAKQEHSGLYVATSGSRVQTFAVIGCGGMNIKADKADPTLGRKLTLMCETSESGAVEWQKDVKEGTRTKMTGNTISFKTFKASDKGRYMCTAGGFISAAVNVNDKVAIAALSGPPPLLMLALGLVCLV